MNTPTVKQFFSNKVTIRLKNGHLFEGLLSSINYKEQSLILEDVEDLGNQTDKNFIPHDKKITEKGFECDNIEQILFKQKHFCEPKKYNKVDFWDAVSQPVAQQPKYKEKSYGQKNDKPYYKKTYNNDNRDNRDNREPRQYNRDNREPREYNRDNRDNTRGDYRRREGGNSGYNNNSNRGGNYRNYQDNRQRNNQDRDRNNNEYRKREENPKEAPRENKEEENDRDYR